MREFIASVQNASLTLSGIGTIIAIRPAASPNVNIGFVRHAAGQSANATSAQFRIQLAQQVVSGSPALTGILPAKTKLADPNASTIASGTTEAAGSGGSLATTESGGTSTPIWEEVMNSVNGFLHVNTPTEIEVFPAGFASISRLWFPVSPSVTANWTVYQVFQEI